MAKTSIQWTDFSFNGWVGCTKISVGCQKCYAETLMDHRYGRVHWGKGQKRSRTSAANWKQPLKWNEKSVVCSDCDFFVATAGNVGAMCPQWECEGTLRRQRVFSASLADWLDDEVPIEWLADFLGLIRQTPNLNWQLLTKRPELFRERLRRVLAIRDDDDEAEWIKDWMDGVPPQNVWFGVSAEDQTNYQQRVSALGLIPAKVRFVSIEPLLGPINFGKLGAIFDWAIFGGESGIDARRCDIGWIDDGVRQCRERRLAPFVKQLGSYPFCGNVNQYEFPATVAMVGEGDGAASARLLLKDKKGGNADEWPEVFRVREFPI